MTVPELQTLFVERLGLRVGAETAAYALRRCETGVTSAVTVVATDARTGVATSRVVRAEDVPARSEASA